MRRLEARHVDQLDAAGRQTIDEYLLADGEGERLESRARHARDSEGTIRERLEIERTTGEGQAIREVTATIVDRAGNGEALTATESKRGRPIFTKIVIGLGLAAAAIGAASLIDPRGRLDLTVHTTPLGARVYFDGVLQPATTPVLIRDLEPGRTYQLRLEADGHQPAIRLLAAPDEGGHLSVQVLLTP